MIFNIDLDRGVISRKDPTSDMEIYMYVDEPGVYRSAHGTEVSEELGRRAGFDVDEHLKRRRINTALAAAQQKVLEDFAAQDGSVKVTVLERDGFKVIDIGYDRYQVVSPDGDNLTPKPLGKHEAVVLLDQLVPPENTEEAEEDREVEKDPAPSKK